MDASIYDTDSFIKDFESCVNDQLKVFNVLVDSIQSFGVVPVKFLNDFLDNIIPNDNTKYIDLLLPIVKNFFKDMAISFIKSLGKDTFCNGKYMPGKDISDYKEEANQKNIIYTELQEKLLSIFIVRTLDVKIPVLNEENIRFLCHLVQLY